MTEREQMTERHDCGGDAAAYALGALEPAEAEAFRRHLDRCAVCRDELEALEGVVQALPMAAPQCPVPGRLRRRVMRAIREEPHPVHARGRSRWTLGWRPNVRPLIATAATAAVAGAVVAGVELSATSTAPARLIDAQVIGSTGSAQLHVSAGRGELVVRHLPAPPHGDVYEVWLQSGHAAPVPASVLFDVGAGGDAQVGLPDSLRGVNRVMVTREPHGGSPAPTSAPLIVATLTS